MSAKIIRRHPEIQSDLARLVKEIDRLGTDDLLRRLIVELVRSQQQAASLYDLILSYIEDRQPSDAALVQEQSVVKNDPDEFDMLKAIGRPSSAGLFVNDSASDIIIIINGTTKKTIKASEIYTWGTERRPLRVARIRIETTSTSSLNYRLWSW